MRAPNQAFQFVSNKDVAGQTFEIISRTFGLADTDAGAEFIIDGIPKDKILVLTNVSMQARPGAGQHIVDMAVQGITAAGLIFDIATERPLIDADQSRSLNWQGEVYIIGTGSGNRTVRLVWTYDAGVASNASNAGVHGIVVPRGNSASF